jgi:hypothetical protein
MTRMWTSGPKLLINGICWTINQDKRSEWQLKSNMCTINPTHTLQYFPLCEKQNPHAVHHRRASKKCLFVIHWSFFSSTASSRTSTQWNKYSAESNIAKRSSANFSIPLETRKNSQNLDKSLSINAMERKPCVFSNLDKKKFLQSSSVLI